jgi:hypothetical protein
MATAGKVLTGQEPLGNRIAHAMAASNSQDLWIMIF